MTDDAAAPGGQPSAGWLATEHLRSMLAFASADPQPARSARRLLEARTHFDRDPARLAVLWPAFLNAVLDPRIVAVLTADDLTPLEQTAELVGDKSGGRLDPEQTRRRFREARETLTEQAEGPAVLRELWQAPPGALESVWRVTRELARRRSMGGELPAICAPALGDVDFLRREPEIAGVLAGCLVIDSRSGDSRARRAAELARYLRSRRIYVPASDRALGFGSLLLDEDYHAAEWHLDAAYASGQRDSEVLAALLCVLIRNDKAARAAALTRAAGHAATGIIAELSELSAALSWLDDLTADGPPPATSVRLRELTAAEMTGEWLRYAIGRLRLIEGDARSAAEILAPLAQAHPDRPAWGYHAAAALALCGDHPQVLGLWERARAARGAWPIGCQLMDLDAECAGSMLQDAYIPPAYVGTVAARIALGSWVKPPPVPAPVGWRPSGGTFCEDIEAFRTSLGLWLLDHDQQALMNALSLPVFAHLPGAERMLWAAIAVLPRYREGGHAMLLRADRLGHPRAALVLTVLHLAEGRHAADDILDAGQHGIRSPMRELLRACSDARAGRHDDAEQRLTRLAEGGDVRARYALADHGLRKATRAAADGRPDDALRLATDAADRLRDLLASSLPRFDDEAKTLLRFAELVDSGAYPHDSGRRRLP